MTSAARQSALLTAAANSNLATRAQAGIGDSRAYGI